MKGYPIADIEEKSAIGKIERLVDFFYEYIPMAKNDEELGDRLLGILNDFALSPEERAEAIEALKKECKAKTKS